MTSIATRRRVEREGGGTRMCTGNTIDSKFRNFVSSQQMICEYTYGRYVQYLFGPSPSQVLEPTAPVGRLRIYCKENNYPLLQPLEGYSREPPSL